MLAMPSVSYLAMLAAIVTLKSVSFVASALPKDYGYWDVNVTSGNAASGYRWGDIYADYSETAGKISHSSWQYSPVYRNITITCDNPEFGSSQVDYTGNQRMCTRSFRGQVVNMSSI